MKKNPFNYNITYNDKVKFELDSTIVEGIVESIEWGVNESTGTNDYVVIYNNKRYLITDYDIVDKSIL